MPLTYLPNPMMRPFQDKPCRYRVGGSTLLVTLGIILIILTFLSVSVLLTSDFGRMAFRQQGDSDLMAAADAELEYEYADWQSVTSSLIFKTKNAKPPTSVYFTSAQPPTTTTAFNPLLPATMNAGTLPFAAKGITFSSSAMINGISVAPGIYLADQYGNPDQTSTYANGTATSNVPGYPGWSGTTCNYVAIASVTSTSHYGFSATDPATLTVRRFFQSIQVPLFQAAIFYENKLEIHPGANMTVTGLIHTNSDLWARGFSTLQFKNTVSYVGTYNEVGDKTITQGWDGYDQGWIPGIGEFASVPMVTWADGLTTGSSQTRASQLNQVSPINPFGSASTSNNGLHDIVDVPVAGSANATSPQIAYNNASVIITVNSSLPTSNPAHLVITNGSGAPLAPADTAAISAAVNNGTTTTIYDQREQQNVVVTNLDMSKLATATVAPGTGKATALQSSFGGTVYIQDVSPATSTEAAIRLVNGSNLGQPVSIATNNGLYIQGDYNTTGASRYPSSVMADAVTILSNNWLDE